MIKLKTVILFVVSFWVIFTFSGCGEPELTLIDCPEHPAGPTTAMIGTVMIGKTERVAHYYKLGTVVVHYKHGVFEEGKADGVIMGPLKDFFIRRGYTPKVMDVWPPVYFIDIGEGVDPGPMLKDLKRVEGVETVYLYSLSTTYDHIRSGLYVDEARGETGGTIATPMIEVSEFIVLKVVKSIRQSFGDIGDGDETLRTTQTEVGKTSDGILYEFGSVLVLYHRLIFLRSDPNLRSTAPKTVYDFLVSKGYEPKIEYMHARLEILRVGECVDTAPMLEALKALPGVAEVHLNIFSRSGIDVAARLLTEQETSE